MNPDTQPTPAPSATHITVHYGNGTTPVYLSKVSYDALKSEGVLWEIYPDAPATWPLEESAADNNAPTPRTETFILTWSGSTKSLIDFARTLERELTEARATLLAREGELDAMSAALAAARKAQPCSS